jgi:hypothetical protein
MSPIDEELRRALRQRADELRPPTDPLTGVEARARGIHRRRLAAGITSAAAAIAVIAAGGSYAAAQLGGQPARSGYVAPGNSSPGNCAPIAHHHPLRVVPEGQYRRCHSSSPKPPSSSTHSTRPTRQSPSATPHPGSTASPAVRYYCPKSSPCSPPGSSGHDRMLNPLDWRARGTQPPQSAVNALIHAWAAELKVKPADGAAHPLYYGLVPNVGHFLLAQVWDTAVSAPVGFTALLKIPAAGVKPDLVSDDRTAYDPHTVDANGDVRDPVPQALGEDETAKIAQFSASVAKTSIYKGAVSFAHEHTLVVGKPGTTRIEYLRPGSDRSYLPAPTHDGVAVIPGDHTDIRVLGPHGKITYEGLIDLIPGG